MCGAASKSPPLETANGQYFAHLHFEMREFITPFIGPGYREKNRRLADSKRFHRETSRRAGRRFGTKRSNAPHLNPLPEGSYVFSVALIYPHISHFV